MKPQSHRNLESNSTKIRDHCAHFGCAFFPIRVAQRGITTDLRARRFLRPRQTTTSDMAASVTEACLRGFGCTVAAKIRGSKRTLMAIDQQSKVIPPETLHLHEKMLIFYEYPIDKTMRQMYNSQCGVSLPPTYCAIEPRDT